MKNFFETMMTKIAEFATSTGIRIVEAILILIIGVALIRHFVKRLQNGKKFKKLSPNSRVLIKDAVKIALYVLLAAIIASTLGIETASITAAIASAGLAVGLALQGSLSNLAGGIMILLFKPFAIGDYIDNGTHAGSVKDIGVFYTTLETVDNKTVTIPNGALSNQSVTDFSAKKTRRLDLTISVGYASDIEKVKSVLLETASAHELVLQDPPPFARLGQQGESALVFYLRVWAKTENYWQVYFDLMEQTKQALDKNEIAIPYPQLDVHLDRKEETTL